MSDVVLKVENLYKRYRLGTVDRQTFKEDLHSWWAKLRGKPNPYEQYITSNELANIKDSEEMKSLKARYIWALQDINFEVKQGEIVGIIGKNGAGKSTLLKILSKTTTPTKGQVKIKGRIASLLEVGTGFHGELTGRENIYLNGAILGMTRHEITRHLDEIIDFAGVEAYIDTPVKRYSSGMYVRLAFAVGAHLLSDILIVDEILAVGDAEFQKKCIGKMKDVSKGEGKTVLFVSHNIAVVRNLCLSGILLENGIKISDGDIFSVLSKYLQKNNELNYSLERREDRIGNGEIKFTYIRFLSENGLEIDNIVSGDALVVEVHFIIHKADFDLNKLIIGISFTDEYTNYILDFLSDEMGRDFEKQKFQNKIRLHIPCLSLRGGFYQIRLFASYENTQSENICDIIENAARINIIPSLYFNKSQKLMRSYPAAYINAHYEAN